MKNTKGITLIALVITIIVLIILASITINLLTGHNGILTRTSEATLDTRGAAVQERVMLWEAEKTMRAQTKTKKELLDALEAERLLNSTERETLETVGEVIIGSKTIKINLSYSLDLVLNLSEYGKKLISFYSSDGGATWSEMVQNELHLSSVTEDILIYMFIDIGGNSAVDVTDSFGLINNISDYITVPIVDTTGFYRLIERCARITMVDDHNTEWDVTVLN